MTLLILRTAPVHDGSGARRGKFYKPIKQSLSLGLDADVVAWFKSGGEGYQTRINRALREYIESTARSGRSSPDFEGGGIMRLQVIAAVGLGLLCSSPCGAAEPNAEARYQSLVAAAKANPDPSKVDWQELRFAAAKRPSFSFEWNDDDRKAMFHLGSHGPKLAAQAAAKRVIEKNYVDAMAHHILAGSDMALGLVDDAHRERAIADGLFQSIRTGDGLSFEHAFTVIAISEEYDFLIVLGVEPGRQGIVNDHNGHAYDIFDTKDKQGKPGTYYFNIDHEWAVEFRPFQHLKDAEKSASASSQSSESH